MVDKGIKASNALEEKKKKEPKKRQRSGVEAAEPPQKKVKKGKCRRCAGCLRDDCRRCKYCLDMPKYGGTGKLRQACVERRCLETDIATPPAAAAAKVLAKTGTTPIRTNMNTATVRSSGRDRLIKPEIETQLISPSQKQSVWDSSIKVKRDVERKGKEDGLAEGKGNSEWNPSSRIEFHGKEEAVDSKRLSKSREKPVMSDEAKAKIDAEKQRVLEVRRRAYNTLKAALSLKASEVFKEKRVRVVAREVEAALYHHHDKDPGQEYKVHTRSLLFNLKDPRNTSLRTLVLSKQIPAEKLCTMSAEELACDEVKREREEAQKLALESIVLEEEPQKIVIKTHKGETIVDKSKREFHDDAALPHLPDVPVSTPLGVSTSTGGEGGNVGEEGHAGAASEEVSTSAAEAEEPTEDKATEEAIEINFSLSSFDDFAKVEEPEGKKKEKKEKHSESKKVRKSTDLAEISNSFSYQDITEAERSKVVWFGQLDKYSGVPRMQLSGFHVAGDASAYACMPGSLTVKGRIDAKKLLKYTDDVKRGRSSKLSLAVLCLFPKMRDKKDDFVTFLSHFLTLKRGAVLVGSPECGLRELFLFPVAASSTVPKSFLDITNKPEKYMPWKGVDKLFALMILTKKDKREITLHPTSPPSASPSALYSPSELDSPSHREPDTMNHNAGAPLRHVMRSPSTTPPARLDSGAALPSKPPVASLDGQSDDAPVLDAASLLPSLQFSMSDLTELFNVVKQQSASGGLSGGEGSTSAPQNSAAMPSVSESGDTPAVKDPRMNQSGYSHSFERPPDVYMDSSSRDYSYSSRPTASTNSNAYNPMDLYEPGMEDSEPMEVPPQTRPIGGLRERDSGWDERRMPPRGGPPVARDPRNGHGWRDLPPRESRGGYDPGWEIGRGRGGRGDYGGDYNQGNMYRGGGEPFRGDRRYLPRRSPPRAHGELPRRRPHAPLPAQDRDRHHNPGRGGRGNRSPRGGARGSFRSRS